ncbi:MAG TPA: NAD(P)/FAD-dependent oxidoreductase [Methanocorpusculum sp.]|nr:NAD(P)/FAD-dependent oxidoreductase [Methanocorpusculum sp.]HJJ54294.1 NAD(P)/FAD-dependent oxidoreductase [Methanocorpusculum sp.]HKL97902.1 NAD(P)/FAD-dependent oxidoreductase [Methanocorpusculum sp.]
MIYVIGGGPAGRMASLRLAGAGKQVTLLERKAIGGTCIHDGCMLICGLNDVARSINTLAFLKKSGIVDGGATVRYPDVIQKLEGIQRKLEIILERETKAAGVVIEYGTEAEIRDGKLFVNNHPREAENIIIAAGSGIHFPDIPGNDLPGTYTAKTIRTMPELPKRIAVIGGGISAVEFAYIYAAFGCDVTIICRSILLPVVPEAMMKAVHRDLSNVTILYGNIEQILGKDRVEGIRINGDDIPFDAVLFATGMKAETSFFTGMSKNADGSIKVDEKMETSIPGIYAAGDVTGAPYFTPVARLQGFAAADSILGRPRSVDLSQIPFTIVLGLDYTICPSKKGIDGVTFSSPNIAGPESFWHVADGSVGSMHLTVSKEDGVICGFATSAPSTSTVGTYLGYLIRKGVTVHEFSPMLEVHPTPDGMYSMIRLASDALGKE